MRAPTLFIVTALLFRPADDQAFLRWPEALETRHLGAQVDLLPLRIEAGGLQSVEATEQVIYEARHLKPGSQRPLRKASTGKHNGRHFSALHLFQCHLMRNEHLFHIQTQPAEDQRTGIGGRRALRIEIDLLALEVFE